MTTTGLATSEPQVVTASAEQLRAAVSMSDVIGAVRDAFAGLARGEFEMPVRTTLGSASFMVMSVHHHPTDSAVVKFLSVSDGRLRPVGLGGTVTWTELASPRAVVTDALEVTRLRTGAVVGVATDLLAPSWADSCTIIGAGAQAADQLRAVNVVRPLSDVRIVDAVPDRARLLASIARDELGVRAVSCPTSIPEAIAGADIVCCATNARQPLFNAEDLAPRAHVNAIGAYLPSMRELPDELLSTADVVIVDERDAALEEAGDVIHAVEHGGIDPKTLRELGETLLNPPAPSPGRTVFKSVGVAVQDWAVARLLARHVHDR